MRISMKIKEFAEFTGVSVRTLHHYEEIGLLKPAYIEKNGYRYYNRSSLLRMQEIMFYRELDFPLKEIKKLMDSPDYDRVEALTDQKKLLQMKKERIDGLISAIDEALKGKYVMTKFDNKQFEMYKEEVKKRWGGTDAYAEYEEKTKGVPNSKYNDLLAGLNDIMGEFAFYKSAGMPYDFPTVQTGVMNLRDYITLNFYRCDNEILAGLGKMYVADERFKKNIDMNGEGTAEYVSKAIAYFVESRL